MTARIYDDVSRLLDDFHSELENKAGNGLAAVGVKYRDKILSNQRSTAICAYAINVAIESRGGRSSGPGWESFCELAEQALRPSKDRKLEEEQSRMRAMAVLWAQWSWTTVTHYKWELLSAKLLTQLGKLAIQFPQWPEFIRNLNYFMLSRHERSLSGGRTQPIGRHHASSRVQDESSPLEACDVACLLKRPPSDIELQTFSGRRKHWTQGTYRRLKVHGKRLSDYPNIRHFRVRVDRYVMLVRYSDSMTIDPRNRRSSHAQSSSITKDGFMSWDQCDIAFSEETGNHTTENDHQEEWVEPAEESILEIRKPRSDYGRNSEKTFAEVIPFQLLNGATNPPSS